jgi:signal transduction histidine kinase
VRLDPGQPRPLPEGLDLAAYRIAQEALTNALRHSDRSGTSLTVHYGPDALTLDIVDDGLAPHSDTAAGGRGLIGMRERAALYGGEVVAGPRPGRGYGVLARLPIPGQAP